MDAKFNVFELLTPKDATFYLLSSSTVRQAIEKFNAHKFSVVPIINLDGDFVGTVSEGDILRFLTKFDENFIKISENSRILDIEKYRSYHPVGIDASFDEVYAMCLSQNFVPVIDDRGKFIGIIKRKDVFIYLNKNK